MRILILILFPLLSYGQLSIPGVLQHQSAVSNEYILIRIPDASITSNHNDFMVYIPLALIEAETGSFFSGLSSDGSDLRVYEDDHTTELNWDTFDVDFTSGTGMLIVHIDLVDGSNNDFIVDWVGTRSAKGAAFHEAAWVNFKYAWHFNKYTGIIDSRNGIVNADLTATNMASGALKDGSPLGKYLSFDGINDYLTVSNNDVQDQEYPVTLYTWLFFPTGGFPTDDRAIILTKYNNTNSNKQYIFEYFDDDRTSAPDNQMRVVSYTNSTGGTGIITSNTGSFTDYDDNDWHLVTVTLGAAVGGDKTFYVDNIQEGTSTTTLGTYTGGIAPTEVGRGSFSSTIYYEQDMAGLFWERTERSAAWVEDFYLMFSNPTSFFTLIY